MPAYGMLTLYVVLRGQDHQHFDRQRLYGGVFLSERVQHDLVVLEVRLLQFRAHVAQKPQRNVEAVDVLVAHHSVDDFHRGGFHPSLHVERDDRFGAFVEQGVARVLNDPSILRKILQQALKVSVDLFGAFEQDPEEVEQRHLEERIADLMDGVLVGLRGYQRFESGDEVGHIFFEEALLRGVFEDDLSAQRQSAEQQSVVLRLHDLVQLLAKYGDMLWGSLDDPDACKTGLLRDVGVAFPDQLCDLRSEVSSHVVRGYLRKGLHCDALQIRVGRVEVDADSVCCHHQNVALL